MKYKERLTDLCQYFLSKELTYSQIHKLLQDYRTPQEDRDTNIDNTLKQIKQLIDEGYKL